MPNTIKLASLVPEAESPQGDEYWGHRGAGVIIMARNTGRFLFGLRSRDVNEPGTWGGFGGKVDDGEGVVAAVKREVKEELGYHGTIFLMVLYLYKDKNFEYFNYLGIVDDEFDPQLNWEHDNYAWVEFGEWPEPLHFGAEKAIKSSLAKIKQALNTNYGLEEDAMDTPPPPAIVRQEPAPKHPAVATPEKLKDAYVVVATLWGEARGEGTEGMQAVLNVIMNRSKGNFTNAASVVLKPKQFSVWNSISDPYEYSTNMAQKAREGKLQDVKQYREAVRLVDQAMKGQLKDITGGATFYFNPKLANPSWAKSMKKTIRIRNHDFYKP